MNEVKEREWEDGRERKGDILRERRRGSMSESDREWGSRTIESECERKEGAYEREKE